MRGVPDRAPPLPPDWPQRGRATGSDIGRYPDPLSPPLRFEALSPTAAWERSAARPRCASCRGSGCGGSDRGGWSVALGGSGSETRTLCPKTVAGSSALGRDWAELKGCPLVPPERTSSFSKLSTIYFFSPRSRATTNQRLLHLEG